MRSVWKFPLNPADVDSWGHYRVSMPHGSTIKFVDEQDGVATVWAEVPDTDACAGTRTFAVVCTGDPIEDDEAHSWVHVGSYQERGRHQSYVYHVYERILREWDDE